MKEQILAMWDKAAVEFAENYGHDSVGDAYIAELRDKISEHSWREDETPDTFWIQLNTLKCRDSEVQQFVNLRLVRDFELRMKPLLEKKLPEPPKVVDRGYKWYKDYGD